MDSQENAWKPQIRPVSLSQYDNGRSDGWPKDGRKDGWTYNLKTFCLWGLKVEMPKGGGIKNKLTQLISCKPPTNKHLHSKSERFHWKTRYVDGTPTSEVTPVTIRYIRPPHHGHTSQYHGHEWMTHILFSPCQTAVPFLRSSYFRLTLKFQLQGQGHGCGQRSYNWPSIILTHFVFISHQSDQQFLRKSYFEIWPWNIQGQGHEFGQRSRSHIVPSIQPMHFLFISHQSDQPFLRYGQNSLTLKKHIRNF